MDSQPPAKLPPNFDPFDQIVTFRTADGESFPVSMYDLWDWSQYGIRDGINYGTGIGASVIMITVVLLLTPHEKRYTAVNCLNVLSLTCNVLRCLTSALYDTGPWNVPYATFSGDYSRVPDSAVAMSIAPGAIVTIQLMCTEASLILQVWAVFATAPRLYRMLLIAFSFLIAAISIGWHLAIEVCNDKSIVSRTPTNECDWLSKTSSYFSAGMICFFSAIFVGKLAYALRQRKKLGLVQFGPMQVIFIMGCQTLILPVVFSFLGFVPRIQLQDQVPTLLSLSLPFSALWAAQSVKSAAKAPSTASKSLLHRLFSANRTRGSEHKPSISKYTQDTSASAINTPATVDEPFGEVEKEKDIEADGGLKIYKKQFVELTSEKEGDGH